MPDSWKRAFVKFLKGSGRTLGMVAIAGGAQIVLSLLVWKTLFRDYPLGFSMGLTLVGFASWFLSFLMGFGARQPTAGLRSSAFPSVLSTRKALQEPGSQQDRGGCGCLLFAASVIPLAIAFILRIQADLGTGKSLQDIFPPMP